MALKEEVLIDIACDVGARIALDLVEFEDSRERNRLIESWAEEFEFLYMGVDWNVTGDYIDKQEEFLESKLGPYKQEPDGRLG